MQTDSIFYRATYLTESGVAVAIVGTLRSYPALEKNNRKRSRQRNKQRKFRRQYDATRTRSATTAADGAVAQDASACNPVRVCPARSRR